MSIKTAVLTSAFLLMSTCVGADEKDDAAKQANIIVQEIENKIRHGSVSTIHITEDSETEAVPPDIRLHYENDVLVCAVVTAPHEVWVNTYKYYYRPNGIPIKYLKMTEGRPDAPAREAIIYGKDGSIVWKNVDQPNVETERIAELFTAINEIRKKSSRY